MLPFLSINNAISCFYVPLPPKYLLLHFLCFRYATAEPKKRKALDPEALALLCTSQSSLDDSGLGLDAENSDADMNSHQSNSGSD